MVFPALAQGFESVCGLRADLEPRPKPYFQQ